MSRLTACVKIATLLCAGLAVFLSQSNSAAAFDRNKAQLFAVLPDGGTLPRGPRRRAKRRRLCRHVRRFEKDFRLQ